MNKVKEICLRKGIVQKELAAMVGVSQPTVSDWFNNKKDPSGQRLDKLSAVLQVSRAVILGLDEAPDAPTKKDAQLAQFDELWDSMSADEKSFIISTMETIKKRKNG